MPLPSTFSTNSPSAISAISAISSNRNTDNAAHLPRSIGANIISVSGVTVHISPPVGSDADGQYKKGDLHASLHLFAEEILQRTEPVISTCQSAQDLYCLVVADKPTSLLRQSIYLSLSRHIATLSPAEQDAFIRGMCTTIVQVSARGNSNIVDVIAAVDRIVHELAQASQNICSNAPQLQRPLVQLDKLEAQNAFLLERNNESDCLLNALQQCKRALPAEHPAQALPLSFVNALWIMPQQATVKQLLAQQQALIAAFGSALLALSKKISAQDVQGKNVIDIALQLQKLLLNDALKKEQLWHQASQRAAQAGQCIADAWESILDNSADAIRDLFVTLPNDLLDAAQAERLLTPWMEKLNTIGALLDCPETRQVKDLIFDGLITQWGLGARAKYCEALQKIDARFPDEQMPDAPSCLKVVALGCLQLTQPVREIVHTMSDRPKPKVKTPASASTAAPPEETFCQASNVTSEQKSEGHANSVSSLFSIGLSHIDKYFTAGLKRLLPWHSAEAKTLHSMRKICPMPDQQLEETKKKSSAKTKVRPATLGIKTIATKAIVLSRAAQYAMKIALGHLMQSGSYISTFSNGPDGRLDLEVVTQAGKKEKLSLSETERLRAFERLSESAQKRLSKASNAIRTGNVLLAGFGILSSALETPQSVSEFMGFAADSVDVLEEGSKVVGKTAAWIAKHTLTYPALVKLLNTGAGWMQAASAQFGKFGRVLGPVGMGFAISDIGKLSYRLHTEKMSEQKRAVLITQLTSTSTGLALGGGAMTASAMGLATTATVLSGAAIGAAVVGLGITYVVTNEMNTQENGLATTNMILDAVHAVEKNPLEIRNDTNGETGENLIVTSNIVPLKRIGIYENEVQFTRGNISLRAGKINRPRIGSSIVDVSYVPNDERTIPLKYIAHLNTTQGTIPFNAPDRAVLALSPIPAVVIEWDVQKSMGYRWLSDSQLVEMENTYKNPWFKPRHLDEVVTNGKFTYHQHNQTIDIYHPKTAVHMLRAPADLRDKVNTCFNLHGGSQSLLELHLEPDSPVCIDSKNGANTLVYLNDAERQRHSPDEFLLRHIDGNMLTLSLNSTVVGFTKWRTIASGPVFLGSAIKEERVVGRHAERTATVSYQIEAKPDSAEFTLMVISNGLIYPLKWDPVKTQGWSGGQPVLGVSTEMTAQPSFVAPAGYLNIFDALDTIPAGHFLRKSSDRSLWLSSNLGMHKIDANVITRHLEILPLARDLSMLLQALHELQSRNAAIVLFDPSNDDGPRIKLSPVGLLSQTPPLIEEDWFSQRNAEFYARGEHFLREALPRLLGVDPRKDRETERIELTPSDLEKLITLTRTVQTRIPDHVLHGQASDGMYRYWITGNNPETVYKLILPDLPSRPANTGNASIVEQRVIAALSSCNAIDDIVEIEWSEQLTVRHGLYHAGKLHRLPLQAQGEPLLECIGFFQDHYYFTCLGHPDCLLRWHEGDAQIAKIIPKNVLSQLGLTEGAFSIDEQSGAIWANHAGSELSALPVHSEDEKSTKTTNEKMSPLWQLRQAIDEEISSFSTSYLDIASKQLYEPPAPYNDGTLQYLHTLATGEHLLRHPASAMELSFSQSSDRQYYGFEVRHKNDVTTYTPHQNQENFLLMDKQSGDASVEPGWRHVSVSENFRSKLALQLHQNRTSQLDINGLPVWINNPLRLENGTVILSGPDDASISIVWEKGAKLLLNNARFSSPVALLRRVSLQNTNGSDSTNNANEKTHHYKANGYAIGTYQEETVFYDDMRGVLYSKSNNGTIRFIGHLANMGYADIKRDIPVYDMRIANSRLKIPQMTGSNLSYVLLGNASSLDLTDAFMQAVNTTSEPNVAVRDVVAVITDLNEDQCAYIHLREKHRWDLSTTDPLMDSHGRWIIASRPSQHSVRLILSPPSGMQVHVNSTRHNNHIRLEVGVQSKISQEQDAVAPAENNELLSVVRVKRSDDDACGNLPPVSNIERNYYGFTGSARPFTLADLHAQEGARPPYNLSRRRLHYAQLNDARLSHSNLERTILSHAELRSVQLRFANCREAVMDFVSMYAADLSHANLRGATFNHAELDHTRFFNGNLERADFSGAQMAYVDLIRTKALHARFNSAIMHHARCDRANMAHADFRNAYLENVSLSGTNLMYANFMEAKLINVIIDQFTNFKDAKFVDDAEISFLFPTLTQDTLTHKLLIDHIGNMFSKSLLTAVDSISVNYPKIKTKLMRDLVTEIETKLSTEQIRSYENALLEIFLKHHDIYVNDPTIFSWMIRHKLLDNAIENINNNPVDIDFMTSHPVFFLAISKYALEYMHDENFIVSHNGLLNQILFMNRISTMRYAEQIGHQIEMTYNNVPLIKKIKKEIADKLYLDDLENDKLMIFISQNKENIFSPYTSFYKKAVNPETITLEWKNNIFFEHDLTANIYQDLVPKDIAQFLGKIPVINAIFSHYTNRTRFTSFINILDLPAEMKEHFLKASMINQYGVKYVGAAGEQNSDLINALKPHMIEPYNKEGSGINPEVRLKEEFIAKVRDILKLNSANDHAEAVAMLSLSSVFARYSSAAIFGQEGESPLIIRAISLAFLNRATDLDPNIIPNSQRRPDSDNDKKWKNRLAGMVEGIDQCTEMIANAMNEHLKKLSPEDIKIFVKVMPVTWSRR